MFNIFENPWGLLTAAVAVALIIWIFRSLAPQKMRWWLWLVPIIIGCAAFAIDFLVETDTEKIEKTIYALTTAVEQENYNAIVPLIAENYHDSYHKTKKFFINHCKVRLEKPIVEKAIPRIVSIEQASPNAIAIFTVRVLFDEQSDISQVYKSDIFFKIQADLEKQPDNQWLINKIEILEIDRFPANWNGIRQ
jgi:hypothetical protein